MHWFVKRLAGSIAACSVVMLFGVSPHASAGNTVVSVGICGPDDPVATLRIDTPATGSTLQTRQVAITGTAAYVSQVRFYVDAVYDGVAPLDTGATSFTYRLMLPNGTHTVSAEGVDVTCHTDTLMSTLTLTYEPAPIVAQQAQAVQRPPNPLSQKPVTPKDTGLHELPNDTIWRPQSNNSLTKPLEEIVHKAGQAAGFDYRSKDAFITSVERFGLFGLGTALLVLTPNIETLTLAASRVITRPQIRRGRPSKELLRTRKLHHHHRLLGIRLLGIGFMSFMFLV